MENNENVQIWWRKIGGGSFRIHGKIIKPNEKFKAASSEIPKAFRNVVIPLENIPEVSQPSKAVVPGKIPIYQLKQKERAGWFDIVNEHGKAINEKPLKEEDAVQLLNDLSR
jgi:hypothetical protein